MAWPPRKHIESLIEKARQFLTHFHIVRQDLGAARALIDLEGRFGRFRIIVSEIHRDDNSVRYAYYVLTDANQLVRGFDNSPDAQVTRLKYGASWKLHLNEDIPHQHNADRSLSLTSAPMTFDLFIEWLEGQT